MPKRDSKAALGQIILLLEQLSAQDRKLLVQRLTLEQDQPENFSDVQTALREGGILLGWAHCTEPERARLRHIAAKAAEFVAQQGRTTRHVLLAVVCRQAVNYVRNRTGTVIRSHVLETLDTLDWNELLGAAYPGYPLQMLGNALCGKLTGSPSVKNQE